MKPKQTRTSKFLSIQRTPNATLRDSERGSSLVEFAVIIPVLSLLVLGVIDFGRAYYLGIEVANAAKAGAQYGATNQSDTAGIQNAARLEAQDVVSASDASWNTPAVASGCECSDGTGQQIPCSTLGPTCAVSSVSFVQVTTSATYNTLIPWPGIPTSFPLRGQSTMRIGN